MGMRTATRRPTAATRTAKPRQESVTGEGVARKAVVKSDGFDRSRLSMLVVSLLTVTFFFGFVFHRGLRYEPSLSLYIYALYIQE